MIWKQGWILPMIWQEVGMESKSRIWVWDETCDEICLDLGNFVRKTKTDLERYYRKSLANNKRTGFWIELVRSWMDRRCSRYWEAGIALEKMIEDTKPNFIYISITSTVYAIRQLNSLWNSNVRAYKVQMVLKGLTTSQNSHQILLVNRIS